MIAFKSDLCFVSRNAALVKSFQNIQVHMQSDTSSHAVSWQVRTPCEPFKKIYVFFFDY